MSGDGSEGAVFSSPPCSGGVCFGDVGGFGSYGGGGGTCGDGSVLGNVPAGSVGADGSLNFNQMCYGEGAGRTAASDSLPLVPTNNITDGGGFNNLTTSFDSSKNVSQHVTDGTFKQTDNPAPQHTPVADGQNPKISVTSDTSKPADFKVKADGTIEVNGKQDFSGRPNGEYKIAVEPGAPQAKTDALCAYLKDQIGKTGENVNPTLEAENGLVSDDLRKRFDPGSNDGKNDDTEDVDGGGVDDNDGGCDGGGGGGGGGGGDDSDLDPDNDTIDNTDKPDENKPPTDNPNTPPQRPFDSMRNSFRTSDYENMTANSLGAYSMNYGNWFSSCLTEEMLAELGNPPDWSKLGKVMKKYANDPKFKAKMGEKLQSMKDQGDEAGAAQLDGMFSKLATDENFANGMGSFLQHQQEGKNATPEEMKTYFGKDIQDAVMSSRMSDMAKDMGIKINSMNDQDAEKLAMNLLANKKLTEAEHAELKQNPTYANYLSTILETLKANRKPAA